MAFGFEARCREKRKIFPQRAAHRLLPHTKKRRVHRKRVVRRSGWRLGKSEGPLDETSKLRSTRVVSAHPLPNRFSSSSRLSLPGRRAFFPQPTSTLPTLLPNRCPSPLSASVTSVGTTHILAMDPPFFFFESRSVQRPCFRNDRPALSLWALSLPLCASCLERFRPSPSFGDLFTAWLFLSRRCLSWTETMSRATTSSHVDATGAASIELQGEAVLFLSCPSRVFVSSMTRSFLSFHPHPHPRFDIPRALIRRSCDQHTRERSERERRKAGETRLSRYSRTLRRNK